MPTVTLKVDEATRVLWVEAAGREGMSLSEWLRRAAEQRLGLADRFVDHPLRLPIDGTEPFPDPTPNQDAPYPPYE